MKVYKEGKPLAQQRHRMFRNIAYDPQSSLKKKINAQFAKQLQSQGDLKPLTGSISATVTISHPIPESWSKKHKERANGQFVTSRPDIDNICKIYFDILNKLGYHDDSQIVALFTQKKYSKTPGVEVELLSIEDDMINEHAITYKDILTPENIDYLTKKANHLGLLNRQLIRAFQEEDSEGKHIYFSVEGIKEKTNV